MANRPAIEISNWKLVETHVDGCKCMRDDGSGQSDRCSEATCGSKCWSRPGANGSTEYQCTKIGYKPSGMMSADDVSRPTTVAAFLSTVGSPQFDAFEGGGFLGFVNAVGKSRAIVTKQDTAGMCDCINKGTCENCLTCKDSSGVSYPCFCWAVVYPIGAPAPDGFQVYTPPKYYCAPNAAQAIRQYNRKSVNTGLGFREGADYERGFRERHM